MASQSIRGSVNGVRFTDGSSVPLYAKLIVNSDPMACFYESLPGCKKSYDISDRPE